MVDKNLYKGYRIEGLDTFAMVKIMAAGKGTIPNALGGLFTSRENAEKQIDLYLSTLTDKKRKSHVEKESPATA